VVDYIIRFLLGDSLACRVAASLVAYTSDETKWANCRVVILPSGFFDEGRYGQPSSLPVLPLQEMQDVPLLYGTPEIVRRDDRLLVSADLIASAFFLLSRYEEYVRKDVRDAHGRFPGRESLPFRANFIDRPIVDEYGRLLRTWLRRMGVELPEPERTLHRVNLTVDVDVPFLYRHPKGVLRGLLSPGNRLRALRTFLFDRSLDPAFTFPWIAAQNRDLEEEVHSFNTEAIYFFKSTGGTPQDKPVYGLHAKDTQALFAFCREQGITFGLHVSYHAGLHPKSIREEKQRLEEAVGVDIRCSRHHFLSCREPEDFGELSACGITDDYTMGYADVAGFRLGTCRPVRWISPASREVSSLTLHPLTVMDYTLVHERYMHLSFDDAAAYCLKLIDRTEHHHGDLTLLWHNHYLIPAPGKWEGELYELLIEDLMRRR
jgi:hypothetical protein